MSGANAFEHSESSAAALSVRADGKVEIRFAGADAGTGQATLLRQIAADELGVSFADTSVTMMESEGTPRDLGAWSSRGTVWGGHAIANTAAEAARRLKAAAAEKFAASIDAVELAGGEAVCGDDSVAIGDLVGLLDNTGDGGLHVEGEYTTDADKMDKVGGKSHFSPSYSFAVQAVEVDVDPETGEVHVVDVVSVHDSGAVLNPAGADGQVAGAVTMGLGAALGEELVYERGRVVNPSYLEYAAPRASDVPTIRTIFLDAHDPAGPHGAKGLGEIGLVPTPAAVANAVAHATGIRVRELPITPDKLLPHLRPPAQTGSPMKRPSRWRAAAVRRLYPRGLLYALDRWGTRLAKAPEPDAVVDLDRPTRVEDALESHTAGAAYLAGGTDLLVARDQGLTAPARLIDLTSIPELARLRVEPGSAIQIGAAVTLETLRRELDLSGDTMLAELLAALATHQIRQMATVGGNLLQEKRCSFYRNGFPCYKRGGRTCPCYAVLGDHRFHHAVIGGDRCQAVTPSDLATGLLALDAVATAAEVGGGRRQLAIDELYSGPGEPALEAGEILTSVHVPAIARSRRSAFEKLQRYAGDFAVCSAAVSLQLDGQEIVDARVALGGVAPTPYRASRTEAQLQGCSIADRARWEQAAEAWAVDAHPLANNRWKVDATCGLLRRALRRALQD